ncbi:hypothetical protein PQR75_00825 [Paraburkholderia fungorum]|uniref:hypothetical protein n=1 Tax=Paraburkholderia fungorum TaxID=134537 RepID=UPI0038BBB19E
MTRSGKDENRFGSLADARLHHAIRTAVIAAILCDPEGVSALLDLPDAELGRRFKERLWEVAGVATVFDIDLPAMRKEEEKLRKRIKDDPKRRTLALKAARQGEAARPERYQLVHEGKLLPEDDFIRALQVTKKTLAKDVASGRVFHVKLGEGEPYYPAFFLSNVIDRKVLARVVRRLRETDADGWSKWDFFTTPIEWLGRLTPLQLLRMNEVKSVLKAAASLVKN